jgi:hypothetical protein
MNIIILRPNVKLRKKLPILKANLEPKTWSKPRSQDGGGDDLDGAHGKTEEGSQG